VQTPPDASSLPLVHTAMTGRAAAKAELGRQMPPRDPVYSTNRIPCSACRSGSRSRPE
jgi:hypothetical protein